MQIKIINSDNSEKSTYGTNEAKYTELCRGASENININAQK